MAKNSIRDFDATSSNNTDIQSVDISEGCSPAGINNAIRELMADIKDVSTGTIALESPSADSLTVTGDLTVDTNTLYVDSTNNRVGVGTVSPSSILHLSASNDPIITLTDTGFGASADITGSNGNLRLNSQTATIFDMADSEVMRLDSSGRLGIGTSSPNRNLQIGDNTGSIAALSLQGSTSSNCQIYFGDNSATSAEYAGLIRYQHSTDSMQFWTSSSERMRIDSSGNVLVGTTSSNGKLAIGDFSLTGADYGVAFVDGSDIFFIRSSTNTSTNNAHYQFYNTNGQVGSITTNGSATSFNTSSDYRLKENIVDAPSSSSDIDAIQVRSFDWKVDGSHQKYGMIAQELLTVAPEAVSQPEDSEEMMGVDYSKLVPMMIKEIQTLRQRITDLENA
jgi:hypothetical protein